MHLYIPNTRGARSWAELWVWNSGSFYFYKPNNSALHCQKYFRIMSSLNQLCWKVSVSPVWRGARWLSIAVTPPNQRRVLFHCCQAGKKMLSYVTIEITTSSSMVHIASYDLSRCQRLSNLSMDQTDLLLRPKGEYLCRIPKWAHSHRNSPGVC